MKAIIFDLDDTLYDYGTLHEQAMVALEEYFCGRFGIDNERFRTVWCSAREKTKLEQGDTAAAHNRLLYCQKTLEKLGLPPAEGALKAYETYWGSILAQMTLREGVSELLAECRERGVKIGICSDLTAHIQHRKLQALGISAQVDCLVTSEEAGVEKPDPRIFQMILTKLDCSPEDAVFVGDSLERDVYGAEACGIPVLWLGGSGRACAVADFEEIRKRLKWD